MDPDPPPLPPPFDMARAVFWLVAAVVFVSVLTAALGVGACMLHQDTVTECRKLDLRSFITELLATVLVLLNFQRPRD